MLMKMGKKEKGTGEKRGRMSTQKQQRKPLGEEWIQECELKAASENI